MANTVRIIPDSGSIAFASNVTNPSASLSSTSIVTKMDSATGVFAIASGSQNILTIDVVNKKVAVDNAIDFKIPVKDGNTYTALTGEIFVDQNAGEIKWAGGGSSKGFKGNTGAAGTQGPTGSPGPAGQKGKAYGQATYPATLASNISWGGYSPDGTFKINYGYLCYQ